MAIYFLVKNTEAYINGGLQYEIETSTASLKVSWVFVVCYSKILQQKLKMQVCLKSTSNSSRWNDNLKWIMLQCKHTYKFRLP